MILRGKSETWFDMTDTAADADGEDVEEALEVLFARISRIYEERGIGRRIGFGKKPALLIVDMANAWTQKESAFACSGIEPIVDGINLLLDAFRVAGLPVVYTTTAYDVTEGQNTDMGLWHLKIPIEILKTGSKEVAIDDRIQPRNDEPVVVKKNASAFHGTALSGMLRSLGVDTFVTVGATASGCVRASIQDAVAEGFRPIAVRDCIGDRAPGTVAWSLYDIDTKFGDVESLETVLDSLRANNGE
jgi:N-carbamoylsarcosine amidase